MTTPVLRGSTSPLPGRPDGTPFGQNTLQATSPDSTLVGDLVLCISWHGTPSATGSAFTLRSGEGWTQLFNYFHDDGSSDGCFAAAWKIATLAGAQVYQAFDDTGGFQWADCRTALRIYSVGTFDSSGILSATPVSFTDGNVAPDPGNVSGLNASRDYLVEAIGGWWHNVDLVVNTPGAPSGYGNLIETSAGGWLELALANKAVSGVTSENPGVFTDNVSATNTNGSVGGTIAILGAAGIARRAIITQAELEVPEADPQRRAIITQAEFETPNKKFPESLTYIFNRSWNRYKFQSIDPQPVGTRQAIITQAELEVPDLGRRAIISWNEFEIPSAPSSSPLYGTWLPAPSTFYRDQHDTWLGNSTAMKIIANFGAGSSSGSSWSSVWAGRAGSVSAWDSWNIIPWLQADQSRRIIIHLPLAASSSTEGRQPLERVAQGLDNVASGLDALADAIFARPEYRDVIIRVGWEFDGNWFPWGILNPGSGGVPATNGPTTFKAAWNFCVNRMKQRQPAAQWTFNLCFSGGFNHSQAYYESVYPGDTTVDNIGLDIYDKGNVGQNGYPVTDADISSGAAITKWANMWNTAHLPQLNAASQFARGKGKKTSLPEWGCHYAAAPISSGQAGGQDNPNFIQNVYNWMNDPNNVCEYHQYFNVHTDPTRYQWRVISSTPPAVLKPFPQAEARYKLLFG